MEFSLLSKELNSFFCVKKRIYFTFLFSFIFFLHFFNLLL